MPAASNRAGENLDIGTGAQRPTPSSLVRPEAKEIFLHSSESRLNRNRGKRRSQPSLCRCGKLGRISSSVARTSSIKGASEIHKYKHLSAVLAQKQCASAKPQP